MSLRQRAVHRNGRRVACMNGMEIQVAEVSAVQLREAHAAEMHAARKELPEGLPASICAVKKSAELRSL